MLRCLKAVKERRETLSNISQNLLFFLTKAVGRSSEPARITWSPQEEAYFKLKNLGIAARQLREHHS